VRVSAVDTAAREKGHAHWTSNLTFILSAMTAAIGLGSIWKFPYLAGSGGGGAFVVVYLLTCAIITVPVLIAELMLGRRGQADPATAMRRVATDVGASPRWSWMGGASILAVFAIGTYYSVVGGWVFAYTAKAATGQFRDRPAAEIVSLHDRFMADPWSLALWHGLFMAATVFVIAFGIRKGIERSSEMFMTALLLILLLLVGYAMVEGDWQRGLTFLLKPDFEALTLRNMLTAVGLSFFTIGTGMAITAASLWWMAHWSLDMSFHPVIWSGLLQGAGIGLIFSSMNLVAFATLPPRHRTDAASLLYLVRNLGASVGISICTAQLARTTQASHEILTGNITETSLAPLNPHLLEGAGSVGASLFSMIDAEITRQAMMIGYINDFYLLMAVALVSIPLVLLLKRPPPVPTTGR